MPPHELSADPPSRLSTGIPRLDEHLGGGLIPGTLTIVLGATGIGKTQLGVQFAHAGLSAENRRGIFYDLNIRGDSQSHADYARRICDWDVLPHDPEQEAIPADLFAAPLPAEYFKAFAYRGQSSRHSTLDPDADDRYRAELLRKLADSIGYFYRHFVHGVRRVVVDGIDPQRNPRGTIQFEMFEYVCQQILKKPAAWVARDLFRESFRAHEAAVQAHDYPVEQLACMTLCTSNETMLDELIKRPLADDDWLAVANTVILMGRVPHTSGVRRALHVAKHRGSACSDDLIFYTIDDAGLQIVE